MRFNENLKYLRKKEKLTQEQLAEKLNVSRQAVTKWEGGQALPDLINLKEMAVMFGVTIDELLGDDNTKSSTTLEKKLKDLPLVIIISMITLLSIITELGVNDVALMSLLLIVVLPLEAWYLKHYLTGRRIINLTNTEEGKRERRKRLLKDTLTIGSIGLGIEGLIYVVRRMQGLETQSLLELFSVIAVYFVLAFVVDYFYLKNEVKKYNKE